MEASNRQSAPSRNYIRRRGGVKVLLYQAWPLDTTRTKFQLQSPS